MRETQSISAGTADQDILYADAIDQYGAALDRLVRAYEADPEKRRDLGFPKLNFQVIRRIIATLGKSKGHPKDIQGLMRHSRLATTMEIYMQSLEKEVRTAINSIHDELVATGTDGPSPQLSSQTQQNNVREGVDSKIEAPSRGKILPFAGKMRANGLGGDLLNA